MRESKPDIPTNTLPPLLGVALCGGKSSRMKQDKALLQYHQQPQYLHVAGMLSTFCEKTVISVGRGAVSGFKNGVFEVVADEERWGTIGPMAGLMSVWDQFPESSLFVVACDYPLLRTADLERLHSKRKRGTEAICFVQDTFLEPLIAVYEKSVRHKMKNYLAGGNTSLQAFLKTLQTEKVGIEDAARFRNVNDPQSRKTVQTEIHANAKDLY